MFINGRFGDDPELFGVVRDVIAHKDGVAHSGVGNINFILCLQKLLSPHVDKRTDVDQVCTL